MKAYLVRLTTCFLTALMLVAGFCYLVDPYSVFGMPRVEGLSLRKPYAQNRALEAKQALFKRQLGDTLFLGDSRVDIAFDPEKLLSATTSPGFNMGVPGAGVASLRKNYLSASSIRPQRTVFVGLDFADFFVSQKGQNPEGSEPSNKSAITVLIEQILSVEALKHSIATVSLQRSRWSNDMTLCGYSDRRGFERTVLNEGHFALFADKNRFYASRLNKFGPTMVERPGSRSRTFSDLSTMIDDMAVDAKRIRVFNYPYHQQIHAMLEARSLDSAHSQWLVDVEALLLAKRKKFPGLDIRFLTIPAYNKMTTEKVPPDGDRESTLIYYWESVHFKPSVGAEIFRLLSDDQCWEGLMFDVNRCISPLFSEVKRTEIVPAGVTLE